MRSQLTRNIFRALIADRPYAFRDCQKITRQCLRPSRPRALTPRQQSRSIFGLSLGGTPRAALETANTASNLDVALTVLADLMRARRTKTQIPASAQIAQAFNHLFRSHLEKPRRFSRNEIFLATEAFKYIQELQERQDDVGEQLLSEEDLHNALKAMSSDKGQERFRSDLKSLGYLLYRDASAGHEEDPDQKVVQLAFVALLSRAGGAEEAAQLLQDSKLEEQDAIPSWIEVLRGLASEGRYEHLKNLYIELREEFPLMESKSFEELVTLFAANDNVDATEWLTQEGEDFIRRIPLSVDFQIALVEYGARNNRLDWPASQAFEDLLHRIPDEQVQDAIVLWYAAQGKSAEEIAELSPAPLTIGNINRLFEFAYSVNLISAVDAYRKLAAKHNIRLDRKSYTLQMEYELKAKNMSAATSTYELLTAQDPLLDNADVPVLNRFLTLVAFSTQPDYDLAMRVVDSLLDRGADLDAETIAGLCRLFLMRDDLEEAMSLLRYRIDSYPMNDRARVSQVFREFILDPQVQDRRALNAYELFRHAFPETSVQSRLPLMHSFFDRKRPDLACLVFGHMRQREDPEGRPTVEAYAQCFEGIAKCKDVDGLQTVYNMLKLDLEVEPTAKIRNGLMAAYTACEQPYTAIIDQFWKIMGSSEGPTLSSFALALRACETWIPQGAQEARRIMAMMQAWNIDITKEIYLCYMGALAGQSEFENTIELIEEMYNDIGEDVDAYT